MALARTKDAVWHGYAPTGRPALAHHGVHTFKWAGMHKNRQIISTCFMSMAALSRKAGKVLL